MRYVAISSTCLPKPATQKASTGMPARLHPAVGLKAFVIEKKRNQWPDGMTGEAIPKIGYHGIESYRLHINGLRVPHANMIVTRAEQGKNMFDAAKKGLAIARVHTAARAIGLARGALEDATAYAKRRIQFRRPIAKFQAIRFKLADMAHKEPHAPSCTKSPTKSIVAI